MQQQVIERASLSQSAQALDHLSDHDRERFWRFGQGPVMTVPDTHIHRPFERYAAIQPDAVAAEHRGETITYAELDRQANRLATTLAGYGVRPGDNVAVFVRRGIPMLVGILGVLKAGGAYVPQDAALAPPAHLRHVIDTAATRVILTESSVAHHVPLPAGHHLIHLDTLMAHPLNDDTFRLRAPVSPGENCYVLFTSGTTGKPNGVVVTHRNVCNILLTAPGNLGIRPGWTVAQLLNVAFDMAAWEILGCLSNGGTLAIRGDDVAAAAERADVIIATPTVLSALDPGRCESVKVVAVAGEPCPASLADQWATRCAFYNGCGPTETTIVNTMHLHDAARQLTIGRPTPNNTVYVLDPAGRPCRIGEIGEMWAGGDGVSAGYVGNPALNAERYVPDPFLGGGRLMFRTRDLGRWTHDGRLEHLGRTDDQVKVRGFRVELDSVSAILESVPGCQRAVTLKLDDRNLVSFVAPSHVDPETARQAVANALPYYCVPAAIYPLPALPETSRGKIDKAALRQMAIADAQLEHVA